MAKKPPAEPVPHGLEGLRLKGPEPLPPASPWIGDPEPVRLLAAAWDCPDGRRPMCPSISGRTGVGKTALAVHTAQSVFKTPVYLQTCHTALSNQGLTMDTLADGGKIPGLRLSPLTKAIISGGVCILKDAGRLSERAWALLAPLLDDRQWLEVPHLGLRLKPHGSFRLAVTLNEGSLVYHLPDFAASRLSPRLRLEMPQHDDLADVLRERSGVEDERLVDLVASYVKHSREHVSVREGLNLLDFTRRIQEREGRDAASAFQISLKAHARPSRVEPQAPEPTAP